MLEGEVEALAGEEVLDGEELEAGVLGLADGGLVFVETGVGGFFAHGGGGFFEGDEDADGGAGILFAFDDAAEVAELADGDVAAFDGDDDGFHVAGGVGEVESAVDAFVGAFFFLGCGGAGADEAQGPVLELVFVALGEVFGGFEVFGLADDLVGGGDSLSECVGEPHFDQVDREVGNVDADPVPVEFLGGGDGRSAATEGVENSVAFPAGCGEDAFKKSLWFLRRISQTLFGALVDAVDVGPDITHGDRSLLGDEGHLVRPGARRVWGLLQC